MFSGFLSSTSEGLRRLPLQVDMVDSVEKRTPVRAGEVPNLTIMWSHSIGAFRNSVNCFQVAHKFCKMQCRLEQRAVIKFLVAQDKSPIQCWHDLQEVYGNRGLGKTRVCHWHKLFKMGGADTPTADKKHPGCKRSSRTDANIEKVRTLLDDDRRKTIRELVVESGLSQGTVHRIIQKDLKFSWICAKFVPRLLTPPQMDHRASLTADNLSLFEEGGRAFLEQIVSGDETWLYCFDPQTKQRSSQWLPKGSKRPEKALRGKTASKKVMLTLFFDMEGPILIHFLQQGDTVDTDEYCRVLARLRENVRLKRPLEDEGHWLQELSPTSG